MAITTASDICQNGLEEIGVLAAGETMTAEDGAFSLDRLNLLIDQWAAQRLQMYTVTRTTWTITSGTASYNVAVGQVVNRARPVYIERIRFQDTSLTPIQEYGLDPLTEDGYANIPNKTLTSLWPSAAYYNPTFPNAVITLWPVPTSSTLQGVLYAPTAITQFIALTDSLSLPPGYKRMMVKMLAIDLAGPYTRDVPQALKDDASDALAAVKVANKRLVDLRLDAGALGDRYGVYWDIRTGAGPY